MTMLQKLAVFFIAIGIVKAVVGITGKIKSKNHTDKKED